MKENLTYDEAIFEHELDVAALELETPREQADNLAKWASRTRDTDKPRMDDLLRIFKKRYRL